jgi:hypothetical protein
MGLNALSISLQYKTDWSEALPSLLLYAAPPSLPAAEKLSLTSIISSIQDLKTDNGLVNFSKTASVVYQIL